MYLLVHLLIVIIQLMGLAQIDPITRRPLYYLYNKCVVADLEPQLQAFCRKTWNCRDFSREVERDRE